MPDPVKSLVDLIQTPGPTPLTGVNLGLGLGEYRTAITPMYQEAWRAAMSQQDFVQRAKEWASTTRYSELVKEFSDKASGTNLFYRLQAHPVGQQVFGGGVRGARAIFEAASTFTGGGPTIEARAQYQQGAFAHASQLTQRLLMQQVAAAKAPTDRTIAGTSMGFGADVPGMMAAEMMYRGHLNKPWGIATHGGMKGPLTPEGEKRIRKEVMRVQSAMSMLSAGRGMFGNVAAPQMFQQIESFFGADVLAAPSYYKGQLREFGEISRAGGIAPDVLTTGVQTFRRALAGTGLPEEYVSARAVAATKNLGLAMATRQNQLGRAMTKREQGSMIQASASQERRRSMSTAGRSLQLVSHYQKMGLIPDTVYHRVVQAAKFGSPGEAESAIQEASLSIFGDEGRIQRVAGSRRGFNHEMGRITSQLKPEAAAMAAEQGMALTADLEVGELSLLHRRERVMGATRDIMRTARRAGVSLDVTAAHRAGLADLQQTLAVGGLAGIPKGRQVEAAEMLERLTARGVSPAGIYRAMEKSHVWRGMVGQAKLVAAEEGTRDLHGQLGLKGGVVEAQAVQREFFVQATGLEGAAEAQREVGKLIRAGKLPEARKAMEEFAAEREGAPDVQRITSFIKDQARLKRKGIVSGREMGSETDAARLGTYREERLIKARARDPKTGESPIEKWRRKSLTKATREETVELEGKVIAGEQKAETKAARDKTERQSAAGTDEAIKVIIVEDRRTPGNPAAKTPGASRRRGVDYSKTRYQM